MTNIQVEVREKEDLLDEKRWRVVVACGDASQSLRWLAFASCYRMALDTGNMPSKYVPQIVKKLDGTVLDANKSIRDLLEDGSEVVVECSCGTNSFMLGLDSLPVDSVPCGLEVKRSNLGNSGCGAMGIDLPSYRACNILELVEWSLHGIEDITRAKSVLSPHLGLLQALVIWYSCQGKELEDKDCGVLNLAQFVQLFQEAMGVDISVETLERIFMELLEVSGRKDLYQMTSLEFLPAIFFVASGVSPKNIQVKDVYTKAKSLIDDNLVLAWNSKIKPKFATIQITSRKECLGIVKGFREIIELCLKACLPEHKAKDPVKLPFRVLLPFLKKWHVLDMNWNFSVVAMLVINALGSYKLEASELVEFPLDLRFGVHELQEFVMGAAYFGHNKAVSPIRISDKAYLQDYLEKLFTKAGVAKPLYTTYDEKKDYLRSILIHRDAAVSGS